MKALKYFYYERCCKKVLNCKRDYFFPHIYQNGGEITRNNSLLIKIY